MSSVMFNDMFIKKSQNKVLKLTVLSLFLALFSVAGLVKAAGIAQDDPQKMVSALSNNVISLLNANREQLETSPTAVKAFAQENVLPYIDTERMARYVLAREWRSASDKQKQEFVEAFTNTLIRSYSQSLLKLKIESVDVKTAQEEKPGRVTVASTVKQADGNSSDVIYRVFLDKDNNKWMLYDVTVEGISLLLNYRKTYASAISQKGLDAVIAEMQEKNAEFNGKF